ncbi:MAG: phage major tail tube protein [Peptococcaceae bacterium]|jgi:P2 family phage contractile tail tube protein|nr:phage major tail tube protein [Peptococcaceae bacterium]MDH7525288.1 phage major tail tube protein [Peptococcaceae bacterium]
MMRSGNIINHRVLVNDIEVDDVINIQLPNIEQQTVEMNGAGIMGTIAMPTTGQFGSLELSISYKSVSRSVLRLQKPGNQNIEIRFVKDYMDSNGQMLPQGSKVFATGVMKSSEGGTIENNGSIEGSVTYEIWRYRVVVDGVEILLIDKLANIFRVDGVDYMRRVNAAL